MNTKLRKIKNNAKALSPVVASIILIAVTVAVSVAVAAWMGGMTLGFMQTEQIKVDNPTFDTSVAQIATVDITNYGTQSVVLSKISINGVDVTADSNLTPPNTLKANTGITVTITTPAGISFDAGSNYAITVITSKGNQFSYSAIAPQ
jgi:flagellin-like protein